jgi:biotin synthase
MNSETNHILLKKELTKDDLIILLSIKEEKVKHALFRKAYQVKKEYCGNVVYLRGLIEMSNICRKDCHYCGIRKSNDHVERYALKDDEVIDMAMLAWETYMQWFNAGAHRYLLRMIALFKRVIKN